MPDSPNSPVESVTARSASSAGRQVLTEDMPQPPGVRERRARRVAKKKRKGPFVKYVGGASQRIITCVSWKTLAIPLKDNNANHVWDMKNDFMIECAEFTDEQLDYLLVDDVTPAGVHNFLEVTWGEGKQKDQLVQVVD